ncbi:MAG: hypothetical protein E5Y81_15365 [Mesorhizobium sp.]|nr:MAG: hypothetical protein E5Y81_15365 [Mesorhizobium sp.]
MLYRLAPDREGIAGKNGNATFQAGTSETRAARSLDDLRTALNTMAELLAAGHLQLPGFV